MVRTSNTKIYILDSNTLRAPWRYACVPTSSTYKEVLLRTVHTCKVQVPYLHGTEYSEPQLQQRSIEDEVDLIRSPDAQGPSPAKERTQGSASVTHAPQPA
jgi:hypothetical protein